MEPPLGWGFLEETPQNLAVVWYPRSGLSGIPRLAWISGSEPPPAVRTPITPLGCPHMPLREDSAAYFYSARLGGGPWSQRGWRALCFALALLCPFRGSGLTPQTGLGSWRPLGAPPWEHLCITTFNRTCQAFFSFFFRGLRLALVRHAFKLIATEVAPLGAPLGSIYVLPH